MTVQEKCLLPHLFHTTFNSHSNVLANISPVSWHLHLGPPLHSQQMNTKSKHSTQAWEYRLVTWHEWSTEFWCPRDLLLMVHSPWLPPGPRTGIKVDFGTWADSSMEGLTLPGYTFSHPAKISPPWNSSSHSNEFHAIPPEHQPALWILFFRDD